MRRLPLVTTIVACLLAVGALPAPQARADDYYPDASFEIVSAQATPATVTVTGRETKPVTITVTTKTVEGEQDRSGTVMALTAEAFQYPHAADASVTLLLVGQKSGTKLWKGVVNVGGPSRLLRFGGAYNCEFGCNLYPTPIAGPSIQVLATDSPALTVTKPALTDLNSPTFTVSGRVLTTSGRSYGRPLPVRVTYGRECNNSDAGVVVSTTPAGHFRATLKNRLTDVQLGAPVTQQQCVKVLADARDIRKRPIFLAHAETTVPWTANLPVQYPRTVKRGAKALVTSGAPLPSGTSITLERLHGRTAWRAVSYSNVRPSNRISSYVKGDALGRYAYRIRNDDGRAVSKPFVVETIG